MNMRRSQLHAWYRPARLLTLMALATACGRESVASPERAATKTPSTSLNAIDDAIERLAAHLGGPHAAAIRRQLADVRATLVRGEPHQLVASVQKARAAIDAAVTDSATVSELAAIGLALDAAAPPPQRRIQR